MITSWQSIFTLVVFFLTNLIGVFPLRFKVPLPSSVSSFATRANIYIRRRLRLQSSCALHPLQDSRDNGSTKKSFTWHNVPINFQTAPPAAVILLLATEIIHGIDVKQGILGTNGVKPISIMALFISLAYLSISLDTTGLFRFLAFWVARKGGSSGRKLYFYLYLFFFASGVTVGNDPVILSGTPFLAYLSQATGIVPPTAWIFAQFSVANMASAVLPSSNPTNLVLTGAFSISFIVYAAYTVLPALAAAAAVYPLLAYGMFSSNNLIPREINVVALLDPTTKAPVIAEVPQSSTSLEGSGRAMAPTRSASLESSVVPLDVALKAENVPSTLTDKSGAIFGSVLLVLTLAVLVGTSPLNVQVWQVTVPPAVIMLVRDIWHDRQRWRKDSTRRETEKQEERSAEESPSNAPPTQTTATHPMMLSAKCDCKPNLFPTLTSIVPRLPLSLVIFVFSMFILVQALTTRGWVEVFAGWWAAYIRACATNGTGYATVGAVGGMLLISTLLCNMCGTNIGTAMLLARMLQVWLDTSSVTISPRVRLGSIYALAIGSNFGAFTFSFSASLAGLLWRDILRQKDITVRQSQFALLNLPIVGVAALVAAAVIVAEMYAVKH